MRIGSKVSIFVKDLIIEAIVTDVRTSFGRPDVKIRPVAGTGESWFAEDSVKLVSPPQPERTAELEQSLNEAFHAGWFDYDENRGYRADYSDRAELQNEYNVGYSAGRTDSEARRV